MNAASAILANPLALLDFRPNVRGALLHLCSAEELELVALSIAAARGMNATVVLEDLADEMEHAILHNYPGTVPEVHTNGLIEAFFVTMYLAGRNALFCSAAETMSMIHQGRQPPIGRYTERIILGLEDGSCVIHVVNASLRIGQPLVGVRVKAELLALEAA